MQQVFSALGTSVFGLSKNFDICTFSMICAKPGLMADTLLILVLPSFRSLWLFPMSMLSYSSNCWLCSWISQDLLWPVTPRLLMNAPKASCMTWAMIGMWFLSEGYSITETSTGDCSLCDQVISGSIISRNTKQTAVSKLKTIKHVIQMYSYPCSSMLALHLSSLICFQKRKRISDQPHQKQVVHDRMPNFDSYYKSWPFNILASLVVDIHTSKAQLTLFRDGNSFLIASTVSAYSLRQMLLWVIMDSSTRSLRNALYDNYSTRFDIAFRGIWAKTNPDMR